MIDESPVASPESGETASAAAYRPHLDGLRAVAVYLVVLFHAGSTQFPGGYIGVDVFFVLSGFLVTQLLLRDINGRGSIRLGRFYARRFRRLLPAAFVTLIVTAVVFSAIASPIEIADAVGSFKAAFLYSTNWYFIHTATGYFGANLATNPVLQFWSLAVEEQFYLVWPLLLGGAFVFTRRLDPARQMRVIRIGVIVAAVASAAWALSLRTSNPNRAYYGTDARAYELLAGATIALVPAFVASAGRFRKSMHIATVVSVAAVVALASSLIHVDAIVHGIAVTITSCVIIIAIEAVNGGTVKQALSSPTVVYLGKISYGTYLWHWLVILFISRQLHLSTLSTIAIASVVATAFASLSYELLERRIRLSGFLDRHRRIVIASGLAISVISALVLIPKIVDPAAAKPAVVTSPTIGFTPVPPALDSPKLGEGVLLSDCYGKPVADCTFVHGRGPSILLIGDSHAAMFIPTFTEIAHREDLTLSVTAGGLCPWQRELYAPGNVIGNLLAAGFRGITDAECKALKDDLYGRVIPTLKPDIIIAVDYADVYANVESATEKSLHELTADGRAVVLVEDTPNAPFDPRVCLSKAKSGRGMPLRREHHTYTPLDLAYRRLDVENSGVFSADLDHLVCPFLPICDPIVNGIEVKLDPTHITGAFAQSIAPQVDAYLKETVLESR